MKDRIEKLERDLRRQRQDPGARTQMVCRGGPYHGQPLSLQGKASMVFSVNGWRGRYVFEREPVKGIVTRNVAKWEDL